VKKIIGIFMVLMLIFSGMPLAFAEAGTAPVAAATTVQPTLVSGAATNGDETGETDDELAAVRAERAAVQNALQERLTNARQAYLEKQQKVLNARERYLNAKQAFLEKRTQLNQTRHEYLNASEGEKTRIREMLRSHSLEAILEQISTVLERLEELYEKGLLTDEKYNEMKALFENLKTTLEGEPTTDEITNDEIIDAAKAARNAWQRTHYYAQGNIARSLNNKFSSLLDRASSLHTALRERVSDIDFGGEAIGGDEPWENPAGPAEDAIGGDEPWENKINRALTVFGSHINRLETVSNELEDDWHAATEEQDMQQRATILRRANNVLRKAHGVLKEDFLFVKRIIRAIIQAEKGESITEDLSTTDAESAMDGLLASAETEYGLDLSSSGATAEAIEGAAGQSETVPVEE